MPILTIDNIHKTYKMGRVDVPVLRGVSLSLGEGEVLAILGASGSGKSTLLHLMGGLDRPDRGEGGSISFRGQRIDTASSSELDSYRTRDVGFVFQFYHLLPELRVLGNVVVASMMGRGLLGYWKDRANLRARGRGLLEQVGLSHRLEHRPQELSGGERQRVAIARALMNNPPLLLADEPTGNLDHETGGKVMDALLGLRASAGLSMVVVTHDPQIAARADRVVRLADGRVV